MALIILHFSLRANKILIKMLQLLSLTNFYSAKCPKNIYLGFSCQYMEVFQQKVSNMNHQDKVCALFFDEMSLKEGVSNDASSDGVEGYEHLGSLDRTTLGLNCPQ